MAPGAEPDRRLFFPDLTTILPCVTILKDVKIFSSELGEVDSCRVERMQQSEDDEEKTIEHIRTVKPLTTTCSLPFLMYNRLLSSTRRSHSCAVCTYVTCQVLI